MDNILSPSELNKIVSEVKVDTEDENKDAPKEEIDESELRDRQAIDTLSNILGVDYSDEQLAVLKHRGNACILACAGSGKALVNGTKVLTPDGYVPIEELKPFDLVFDEKGERQVVLRVYPQGPKQVYEVKFNDGHVIKCCGEHLWTIKEFSCNLDGKGGYYNVYKVVNTEYIRKALNDDRVLGMELPTINIKGNKLKYSWFKDCFNYTSVQFFEKLEAEDNLGLSPDVIKRVKNEKKYGYIVEIVKDLFGEESKFYISVRDKKLFDDIRLAVELMGGRMREEVFEDGYYTSNVIGYRYSGFLSIEKTETFEEMTCIKVSGKSELFLTEHCYATHNTTILTNLVAKRIMTGEIKDANRLLCTTYSKDGARELEERLEKLLKRVGINQSVRVKTIHAFCYSVINRYFQGVYRIIDDSVSLKLIRQACSEAKFRPKDDDVMLIASLLSFQVNNLLTDSATLSSPACKIDDLELSQYTAIRTSYSNLKRQEKMLDFDDMQLIMWSWLVKDKNKEVLGYCKSIFDHVLIDEAQDMSRIQYQIIKAIVADTDNPDKLEKTLVVVGDEDQCIYKWRGADPSIILDICPEFDIKKFVLSTNYRCKSEIVNIASVGIKNNLNRVDKDMKAFEEGGRVRLLKASHLDMYEMSRTAFDYIKSLVDSGVNCNDIAVLSRNNFHLAILSNMCFRNGIYSSVSPDMRLTRNIMYKDIKAIINLVDNPWDTSNVKQVLWKMCRYLGISNVNTIVDFQENSALGFNMALEYLLKNFSRYKAYIDSDKTYNIPSITRERMKMFFNALSNDTVSDLYNIYCCFCCDDRVKAVKALLGLYVQSSCSFIYKNKDKERTVKGLVRYFIDILEQVGLERTLDFLRRSEQLEDGKMDIPGPKVTMSTMHSAKGREWEHVIIFGDDNVSIPNFSQINKMIGDGVSIHDINSYIDEDRRLHYVATTRAKSDLTILTSSDMSVYLLEALGLFKDEKYGNNSHIIAMAQEGYIYTDLYQIIQGKVFGVSNRYFDKVEENDETKES